MMQFNTLDIRIFNELYAYCRLKHHSEFEGVPDIVHLFSHVSKQINYNEGQTYCNNTDFWYNYPKNMAIIIDADYYFVLQTVTDNTIGKFYRIDKDNETEIRNFFEKTKGDVVVLENKYSARMIKPDYESLLIYTQKMTEIKKRTEEFQDLYLKCRERGYELEQYKKFATQDIPLDDYNYIIHLTKGFIKELTEIQEVLKDMEIESLKDIVIPVSEEEAYGVSFALLYRLHLKSKKRKSFHDRELKTLFSQFVTDYPDAVDYFCKGVGKKFDKENIVAELKRDCIITEHFDSVADEILA